jgi:hypothetical protein
VVKIPDQLRVGATEQGVFERRPDLYAIRRRTRTPPDGALAVIPDTREYAYAVYRAEQSAPKAARTTYPVYSAGPTGPLAVATGKALVRLRKEIRAEEKRKDFDDAGFEIEQIPSYAPNAAWLRPKRRGVARALSSLEKLQRIGGVEHVEAQLLLDRAFKRA